MLVTRDDQAFDRRGIMLLDRRGHGGGGLAGADDDGAALGRRDFRQIGRQAKRRMRRAHGGVEHFAKEFAVIVGHGGFQNGVIEFQAAGAGATSAAIREPISLSARASSKAVCKFNQNRALLPK